MRALAPDCRLHSVRVLGGGATGSGDLILAGLRHAVEQGYHVVNLSLSTTKRRFVELLHELADSAYFGGSVLVAAAHNLPVESYPWRFSSVISVGSHGEPDGLTWYANPSPPVEFFARGVDVEVAWPGGGTHALHGEQLRRSACQRALRARAREASRPDPVPAEEPPLPDRRERAGGSVNGREELAAAATAAAAGSDEDYRALLRSIVDVARAIFSARASSVLLLDEETDELVFEAVSGEGEDELVGRRFPASTGVAGWVLVTRQPLVLDDLDSDPRFARGAAEATGYVPRGLMAVPLLHGERALGVLEVLDRPPEQPFTLAEMELLGRFATQAAIALDLLGRMRRARASLAGGGGGASLAARLAALLEADDDGDAQRLLEALEAVLSAGARSTRYDEQRAATEQPGRVSRCVCERRGSARSDSFVGLSSRPSRRPRSVAGSLTSRCASKSGSSSSRSTTRSTSARRPCDPLGVLLAAVGHPYLLSSRPARSRPSCALDDRAH